MRDILHSVVEWAVLVTGSIVIIGLLFAVVTEVFSRVLLSGKAWERVISYVRHREEFHRWRAQRRVKRLRGGS